jgi:anti-anti-sigma factor
VIEIAKQGESAVIKPGGDVVAAVAGEMRAAFKSILADGVKEITVDLGGVEVIDSIGLGVLIAAHNSLKAIGGKLLVTGVSRDIYSLMVSMRLNQHFTVTASS